MQCLKMAADYAEKLKTLTNTNEVARQSFESSHDNSRAQLLRSDAFSQQKNNYSNASAIPLFSKNYFPTCKTRLVVTTTSRTGYAIVQQSSSQSRARSNFKRNTPHRIHTIRTIRFSDNPSSHRSALFAQFLPYSDFSLSSPSR